jgi:hypothetical protein
MARAGGTAMPGLAQVPADPVMFAISLVLLTLGLTAVCWLKGEPPRWRSGD